MARRHNTHTRGKKDINGPLEEVESMRTNSGSALSIFGGPEKVFGELTRITKERLKNRSDSDLNELEHYLGLDEGVLLEIKSGKKEVDKKIFLGLKSALRLSLHEALGEPKKLKENGLKKYWEEKWKSKPMRLVAYESVPSRTRIPGNPIDLKAYVTLRAIGEFYRL